MSRCKVCEHPSRGGIEVAIVHRVPLKAISRKFGPSVYSIHRHRHRHMTAAQIAAMLAAMPPTLVDLEQLERSESEGLLQTLIVNRARAYRLLDLAEESGDYKAAANLLGKVHENVALTGKLLGAITTHATHTTNNLTIAPDWIDMRTGMMKALRDFPEARKAVSSFLLEFETRETLERVDAQP